MKITYIIPQIKTVELDGDGLLMQGSDVPDRAYNQYSSDDACVREEQAGQSLWNNEW